MTMIVIYDVYDSGVLVKQRVTAREIHEYVGKEINVSAYERCGKIAYGRYTFKKVDKVYKPNRNIRPITKDQLEEWEVVRKAVLKKYGWDKGEE